MKAIYAFSGDPITFGHIDIIKRATKVFDHLIVAIGNNTAKKYTFTLEERTAMATEATKDIKNITVTSFNGLLVDFAYMNGIPIIIRGIRNNKDFDYEYELYFINANQKYEIDTFFIPAKQDLTHVSSSAAKALQLEQGLIHEYVPVNVKKRLEQVISQQYIIGITGEIASGKSFLGDKLVTKATENKVEAHNIDMDSLGHKLLSDTDPLSIKVQSQVVETFPNCTDNGTISRKLLGDIIFNDKLCLKQLNEIMREPLLLKLRQALYNKKGFIFINSALLAEFSMGYLCNNTVIITDVDVDTQYERLLDRNLTEKQIERRLQSQYDYTGKLAYFSNGKVWTINERSSITSLFIDILFYFRLFKE